jgi:hypothetical protein
MASQNFLQNGENTKMILWDMAQAKVTLRLLTNDGGVHLKVLWEIGR